MVIKLTKRNKILIVLCTLIFLLGVTAQAGTIQVPKGQVVKVKFAPGMKISSGELAPQVPLLIYLAEPIEIGGKTVVEEGAQGTAKVVEVKKAGKGGKPGYIKVAFQELDTKGEYLSRDNAKIKLEGELETHRKG